MQLVFAAVVRQQQYIEACVGRWQPTHSTLTISHITAATKYDVLWQSVIYLLNFSRFQYDENAKRSCCNVKSILFCIKLWYNLQLNSPQVIINALHT